MLNRIKRTGLNVTVLIVSILVFLIAFVLLIAFVNTSKPQTMDVLSAARDLNVGDVIGPTDIAVKTVYVDSNSSLYISADQQEGVVNGIVAVPIYSDQPIFKTSILAPAGEGSRISAVLAKNPGDGLFPLPLDKSNVVAPSTSSFMPGDLVDVTIVISTRPQPILTPTAAPSYYYNPANPNLAAPSPTPLPTLTTQDAAKQDADARTYPPFAKSLLPAGVRVIAVQGLPPSSATNQNSLTGSTTTTTNSASSASPSTYADYSQPRVVILMVPLDQIEELALALQEGDLVVVSLISKGSDKPTPGFTYWDLEQVIRADRQQAIGK
jgi:Flp pilus assembly protein CpaB